MNFIRRRYCRSGRWKHHLNDLLPCATAGLRLDGADVLELGSGPGQTTDWLRTRVGSLTAVEYDRDDAEALRTRLPDVTVVHGDATDLPFEAGAFDAVVCFTMLHHVPTGDLQDRLFTEAARVLKPGGVFAGSDSRWGPLFAVAHVGDTMSLIDPHQPRRPAQPGRVRRPAGHRRPQGRAVPRHHRPGALMRRPMPPAVRGRVRH